MAEVTVRKLDHAGRPVAAYPGRVLRRGETDIVLRTQWMGGPRDLGYAFLEPGDRWTEHFYADRWYNIFEIRDGEERLKGWYCNITRPARISGVEVSAEDLALDLWVAPDGEMLVLDEDEFAALPLPSAEREMARAALSHLQDLVDRRAPPFDGVREAVSE